jgi:hypothetical protein
MKHTHSGRGGEARMSCEGPSSLYVKGERVCCVVTCHPPPPTVFRLVFKDEHKNHTACEVWLIFRFQALKMFVRRKFKGRLLKCIIKLQ